MQKLLSVYVRLWNKLAYRVFRKNINFAHDTQSAELLNKSPLKNKSPHFFSFNICLLSTKTLCTFSSMGTVTHNFFSYKPQ